MKQLLAALGIIGFVCLVIVFAPIFHSRNQAQTSAVTTSRAVQPPASVALMALPARPKQVSNEYLPVSLGAIAPLPPDAKAVPDDDLLKLSGYVNLAGARDQLPDKARWAQAVPVAEDLMNGPCDCDQRNWLKHFVKMGKDALANASTAYLQDGRIMAGLRRNDMQPILVSSKTR